MSNGWWNESVPHGLASKGVKTKTNMTKISTGMANKTAMKNRVGDGIQNDMHGMDKLLRKAVSSKHHDDIVKLINKSEKIYEKLTEKIKVHKEKYGELDWWVSQTWHGHENFNGNGKVRKLMEQLKNSDENKMKSKQLALWDAIKLPTESSDPNKKLSEAERKKSVQSAYDKAIKNYGGLK